MPDPRLIGALDALGASAFEGHAYRHLAENRHPLSGAGARSQGGRWNPPQSFATLYLGLEIETVHAEFLCMATRQRVPTSSFLPRRMYRYEIRLTGLVDLRAGVARQTIGLPDADLASDNLSRCQAIGEAAQYLGREGIIAPSATGNGIVLAVFADRLQPESIVRDLDYTRWEASAT